jgi:hypothetical protein
MADQNDLIEPSKSFVLSHRAEVEALAREVSVPFKVGDLVLVKYPNRPPSKLRPKWRGPYRILSRNSTSTFTLQHVSNFKEFVQHVSMMKPFNDSRSDPIAIASVDDDEYEVEAIIGHRGKSVRNLSFRVRWVGYPPSQDSWLRYRDVKELAALDAYIAATPSLGKLKLPRGKG